MQKSAWIGNLQEKKLKKALFDLGKLKAPRPNGFQASFYQEYWEIVGDDIIEATLDVLKNNISLRDINQTFITLTPNIKNLEKITQHRPVSLCNVIYKIISKTQANRFKEVIQELISENWWAFIKGR